MVLQNVAIGENWAKCSGLEAGNLSVFFRTTAPESTIVSINILTKYVKGRYLLNDSYLYRFVSNTPSTAHYFV